MAAAAIRALALCAAASSIGAAAAAARRVECIAGDWKAAPSNCPTSGSQDVTDGAFSGNGDLAVIVGASPVAPNDLSLYFDLMQFRCPTASPGASKCGYSNTLPVAFRPSR